MVAGVSLEPLHRTEPLTLRSHYQQETFLSISFSESTVVSVMLDAHLSLPSPACGSELTCAVDKGFLSWATLPLIPTAATALLSVLLTFQFQEVLWHSQGQEPCQNESIKKPSLLLASLRKGVNGFLTCVCFVPLLISDGAAVS